MNSASSRKVKRSPETKQDSTSTASAGVLTLEMLDEVWATLPHNDLIEVVLVAPNKKVYKLWEKIYPGIRIVLQKDYKGYSLLKYATGLHNSEAVRAKTKVSRKLAKPTKLQKGKK